MHNELQELARPMPCKQIDVGGVPYLRRRYAGTLPSRDDVWLHHFLSADGDRHVHCHPFEARSIVLSGGYEVEIEDPTTGQIIKEYRAPAPGVAIYTVQSIIRGGCSYILKLLDDEGYVSRIKPTTWHRISGIERNTWTMMIVEPGRLPMWFFKDPHGCVIPQASSSRDWWRKYGPMD